MHCLIFLAHIEPVQGKREKRKQKTSRNRKKGNLESHERLLVSHDSHGFPHCQKKHGILFCCLFSVSCFLLLRFLLHYSLLRFSVSQFPVSFFCFDIFPGFPDIALEFLRFAQIFSDLLRSAFQANSFSQKDTQPTFICRGFHVKSLSAGQHFIGIAQIYVDLLRLTQIYSEVDSALLKYY